MKKISVIIPCYNVSGFLDRCMISVTRQTFDIADLEIILIDDASTDDTWDKIQIWEKRFSENVIAVHCDKNGGLGRARNTGLSYASSEWVCFLDSDDYLEFSYFEKLYTIAVREECDVVCCRFRREFSSELTMFEKTATGNEDCFLVLDTPDRIRQVSVLASIPMYAPMKLIKRNLLMDNSLFFPERLAYEDNLWASLLPYYAKRVYILEEALYHYYVNEGSLVLKKDADYHVDLLTVHMKLWDEYLIRGLYPEYKDEIEYNFLYTCFLGFLKILANRFEHPDYSQYLLMKYMVLQRIPDFRSNRYIKNGDIKEFHLALIEMLDRDVDKKGFEDILEAIRRSGM